MQAVLTRLRKLPALSLALRGLVLLAVLLAAWLLVLEYQATVQTLTRQQVMVELAIRNTLAMSARQQLAGRDTSAQFALASWRQRDPDFYIFSQGLQRFPFTYRADSKVEQSRDSEDEVLQERNDLVQALLNMPVDAKQEQLREHVSRWLLHRLNYDLGPRAEVSTSLRLFSTAQQSRWSSEFTSRILLDGWQSDGGYIPSLAEILLRDANAFSFPQLQSACAGLVQIADDAELDTRRLKAYFNTLLQPVDLPVLPEDQGQYILASQWLLQNSNGQQLLLPLRAEQWLADARDLLLSQGVLEEGDNFYLSKVAAWQTLDQLQLELDTGSLQREKKQALFYLLFKSVLLLALLSLASLAWWLIGKDIKRRQALVKQRESWFSLVTHDFKTPLAAVRVMAETLAERQSRGLEPRDYSQRILGEVDKMEGMVDNMLNYHRLTHYEGCVHKQRLPLARLVQSAVEEFRQSAGKAFTCQIEIDSQLEVEADHVLMVLVLRNLLSNALQYCERDPIEIAIYAESNCLLLSDNAVGIDQSQWQSIFAPHGAAKDAASKGSGLGLALSKKILQAHGGDIRIQNSSKSGTLWEIDFGKDNGENPAG